ncbi:MAG TPA: DUF4124 domain-containing protein [Woeseiaceae bacterium]|nr:DUF4124 domain-containing protein [Woeseiaceae bacterium]
MKILLLTVAMLFALPQAALAAAEEQKLYRWVDREGVVHYGDSVPAEYAEVDKQIVNEHGVTLDVLRGKKSDEELAAEKREDELRAERELRRRQDQALLATYLSIDEILMHRDRRVELFQAQSRVTELYLRNLQKRLATLEQEASRFLPYSEDPDAPMIDPALAADIATTTETIARHEQNLQRFQKDEQNIVARFDGDISRFKSLKGLD